MVINYQMKRKARTNEQICFLFQTVKVTETNDLIWQIPQRISCDLMYLGYWSYKISLVLALVMPGRMIDLLASWRNLYGNPQIVGVWKMVLTCLIYCISRKRNDRNFEGKEHSLVELRSLFSIHYFYMQYILTGLIFMISLYLFILPN